MKRIIDDIETAVCELKNGHILGLPTETVYGLAADATNTNAVREVFTIKSRPLHHPLILHVAHKDDVYQWVEHVPDYAETLMDTHWPGPLTLVFRLKRDTALSPLVTAGQESIAIRCPGHASAREIIRRLGAPVAAPSANRFGHTSPTEAQHVLDDFPDASFYVFEGGNCSVGIESTIVNAMGAENAEILRPGIITLSSIPGVSPATTQQTPRVSGSLKQHYQPQKPLYFTAHHTLNTIFERLPSREHCALLGFSTPRTATRFLYVFAPNPEQASREFYRQLRLADRTKASFILVELPPRTAEWAGLLDRAQKAGRPVSELLG
ncbi:SUA5/yciO/yrdC family transporter:Sua5/YciO/YrdC/YwlC family transporter protein [Legionella geestiana]|uniref:Threonylcarbamoyl-AMP synthase n=1 Tax=Legionella geestiana TaxID=45065 RepID=A0A0W0TWZ1_9GAMM|nr:L-threonylcarbamoyladenylate synthase [Legionella geestiana]KTD00154.1 SUA5/yciO/yrdC family transporter:Sua5/YciO/YrdC/YwlC family transporter protein [Legionella geestiana]QBS11802.1 threonylcarbamoyl-AMP synthase [Legionella geestiana]QDQ40584.1 threonylcarbamoyl-AMP synthase [Legionella geestiana]STX53505.1 putative translation factor [Legionella geestiana]